MMGGVPEDRLEKIRVCCREVVMPLVSGGRVTSILGSTVLCVLGGLADFPQTVGSVETAAAKALRTTTSVLSLTFQPNRGQYDAKVKFLARQGSASLLLTTESGLVLDTTHAAMTGTIAQDIPHPSVVRMRFVGANATPKIRELDLLPGKHHYLVGNDPTYWHTDIPLYARVRYDDVYPGVDIVYYGNEGRLEFDAIVEPGADPHDISLRFSGVEMMVIDSSGNLVLAVAGRRFVYQKPVIYQDSVPSLAGIDTLPARTPIKGEYQLTSEGNVEFRVAAFDRTKPLVIDPVLVYSTYLGGNGFDQGGGVGVDANGNMFVAGTTNGTFPAEDTLQSTGEGLQDVFISKLTPQGDALIYSVVIGGHDIDVANDIAVDAEGHVYVVGSTFSEDFPATDGVFQPTIGGGVDAFVLKLDSEGSALMYSTFLGKTGSDIGLSVAVDVSGQAFVTGRTRSDDFPTSDEAVQSQLGGGGDAFVTRLNASGSELLYSTYLGGIGDDQGEAIAVDSSGQVVVTGVTGSENFPTTAESVQPEMGGQHDAFVARINSEGTQFVYSTYLGGEGNDEGLGVALDDVGNVYAVGATRSSEFPTTTGVLQQGFGSIAGSVVNRDVFVSKIDPTGQSLLFSTYLGGQRDDVGNSIAIDDTGHAYITGRTTSNDFPVVSPVQGEKNGGVFDGEMFVSKLNPDGDVLSYSTYVGGEGDDSGVSIIVDPVGNAYVAGRTTSADFPTTDALQENFGRASDVVIVKIADVGQPRLPDLSAVITKFKHKVKESGDQLVVKLNVRNFGAGVNVPPFFVALFVSDDNVFDDGDRPARQSMRINSLESGERKFKVGELEPLAEKFAIVVIDDGDAVSEGNENNNVIIRSIEE